MPRPSCHGVFSHDTNTWWGLSQFGTLTQTTNGGVSWTEHEPEFLAGTLGGIFFNNRENGWVVGSHGTVYHTTNGGQSWEKTELETKRSLRTIHFFTPKEGVIACGGLSDPRADWGNSSVLRTSNGGGTWTWQAQPECGAVVAAAFTHEHAWICDIQGRLLRSRNKGAMWGLVGKVPLFVLDMEFVDDKHGWIVGDSKADQRSIAARTIDGGIHWEWILKSQTRLGCVSFLNQNIGWVVGEAGTAFRTTDGGATWEARTIGTSEHVTMVRMFAPNDVVAFAGSDVWCCSASRPPQVEATAPAHAGETDVDEVLARVLSTTDNRRLDAMLQLSDMGKAVVPRLRQELLSTNQAMRAAAAEILAYIRKDTSNAVPDLVRQYEDKSVDVRSAVVFALGQIGRSDEAVLKVIAAATRDAGPNVRRNAAYAFALLRPDDPGSLSALTRLLKDEQTDIRFEAAKALRELGVRARPRLR